MTGYRDIVDFRQVERSPSKVGLLSESNSPGLKAISQDIDL